MSDFEKAYKDNIVKDYQQRGYKVTLQPLPESLPDFLASFHPDFLATKPGQNIVGVVKMRPVASEISQEITRLSEIIQSRKPEWNFLLALNDVPHSDLLLSDTIPLTVSHMCKLTDEAAQLIDSGHPNEAVSVAWPAIETLLRQFAAPKPKLADYKSVAALLEALTYFGIISQVDYRVLWSALEIKQSVLQNHPVEKIYLAQVGQLPHILKELIAEKALTPVAS